MPNMLTFFSCDYTPDLPKKNLISVTEFFQQNWHNKIDKKPVAFDFEDSGLDLKAKVFWARCVSFHNDEVSLSVQIRDKEGNILDLEAEKELFKWLSKQHKTLIAHNYQHDGGVILRATGKLVVPRDDTYVMFKYMSTEHYENQQWDLGTITTDIFDLPPYWLELYKHLKEQKLGLSDMCKADWDILGWYNQLDSFVTWEFWKKATDILKTVPEFKYLPEILEYEQKNMLLLFMLSYDRGLVVDKENLSKYAEKVKSEIEEKYNKILNNDKIIKALEKWDAKVLDDYYDCKPKIRYTKDGNPHKQYLNSLKRWENSKDEFIKENQFNVDSPDQLKWLVHQLFDIRVEKGKAAVYEV